MSRKPAQKLKPDQGPNREAACQISNGKQTGKRILVVDDDPQIRESLRKVLRAEGYDVLLAADGQEGVAKANTDRIDLLLLDVSLPDMSGWDVFGSVTSLNPFLPILIITGRTDQKQIVTLSGVSALIQKPLDVPELLRTIADMLAEPAETHLQRLVGLHRSVRHVPSDASQCADRGGRRTREKVSL